MKIALVPPDRKWSVYYIMKDLDKYLDVDTEILLGREPSEEWLEYDRIFAHFGQEDYYNTSLFQNDLKHKTYMWLAGEGYDRVDWTDFEHVIAQSEFIAKELRPIGTEVNVCQAGVDTDIFKPIDIDKEYDVVWVGNTSQGRNRIDLVKKSIRDYDYYIHDGWNDEHLSRKEMAKLYNKARSYIMLSRFEGGSMPLIEAMACGIPVVSTKTGYAPNLIEEGVNGITIDEGANRDTS